MNMIRILCGLSFILGLCSCKKVIDLELKESDIKYVVEGAITNEPGVCKVYLSQSKQFNEDNQFPGVSGAVVTIKDNGVEFPLMETQPGAYETKLIKGTPGHVYQLTVTISSHTFTASCTMPQPVHLDSLYISEGPFGQFDFATIQYKDPKDLNNRYRFVQYVNGVKDPAIFLENDEFTNGNSITMQLDNGVNKKDDPRNIRSGDEVTVEMLCLDEVIYKYWYSLDAGGGDGSGSIAAPANPLTNISGGALGYFSAHTISRQKVIAP
ncbi:DUF4249 domain-containing protein [Chitinophagaceae bacterium LB-8]|uniref:DUF4249 domain-containing protein n=1 Tax=Paraflavisolibacter caeni TaxID=2982496 RepID=A0A9X2XY21_9BACT|nr:DUF4249 domain-containing protein [Paraflavisolibacter caeni]MCU7550682.1 DUF4249 domain-containing protein [Paraflavisolibacter caeni]